MDDLEINELIEYWELSIKQKMTDGAFKNIFYQAKIKWFNNEYFEGEIIQQHSNSSFKVQSGYASNGPFMGVISFEVISDDGSVRSFQGNIVDELSIWGHCTLKDEKQVNGIRDEWYAFRIGKYGEGIIYTNNEIIFEVDSNGTIRYSDFYEIKTRADAYDMTVKHDVATPGRLISFAKHCHPLQWLIGEYYTEYRSDPAYPDRLKSMSEEPEDGWIDWVMGLDKKTFSSLRKGIKKWLSEEPQWGGYEEDHIHYSKQNEGAVFYFFEDEEYDVRHALGVGLIDGPYPGSNYCGAKLLCSIEKANAVAQINGLDYRFRKKSEEELNETDT